MDDDCLIFMLAGFLAVMFILLIVCIDSCCI